MTKIITCSELRYRTLAELEALFLESRLIKRYLPDANQLQRNDRDYPFIRVDATDPFPRRW